MNAKYNKIEKLNNAFEDAAILYHSGAESYISKALISIPTIIECLPRFNGILSLCTYGHLQIGKGGIIDEDEVVTAVMTSEISLYHQVSFTSRSLGIEDLTKDQLHKLLINIVDNVTQAIYDEQYL